MDAHVGLLREDNMILYLESKEQTTNILQKELYVLTAEEITLEIMVLL